MPDKVTKSDIPTVETIKAALLETLTSGRSRSFDNVSGDVAKALGVTRAQRAYRIGTSVSTLFENRLIQARRELVKGVKRSSIPISLSDAKARGFDTCKVCWN